MLVGGLRALLLQTLHPATMAGVAQHSAYREDPWGRFRRTSAFVGITTFGSEAAADKAIRQVRHVHERVVGIDSNGQPYRANDPHLLAWVHATEIDSFLRAHLRYGDPLAIADQDRYVDEMAELARRLGVINPPTSRSELREYLVGMRPELEVTPETREAVRFLLAPPVPLAQRAAYAVLAGGAVELLPGFVRRMLWLPLPPGFALAARPATASVLAGLQWLLDSPGRAPVS